MIIERGCWANCSEATIRFRTDKLTAEEETKLFNALQKYAEEGYETFVTQGEIFGIRCVTVNGDGPYNESEKIMNILNKFSFKKKVETEREE